MKSYFPFLNWMSSYNKKDLNGDISAGLTVGVMLIPQGMAYSMLAGLPPIYGLYASTIPLIIYALFGTSRQLAVGPVAMVALLISSGVGAIAAIGSEDFISLAILLALMVGVIQFAMGAFRLGFLVNFLSHPVIAGFTSAAALIIGFSQLKHLFGVNIPRGKVHETIMHLFEQIGDTNWYTFAVGAGAIVILLLIKKFAKKVPGPLIAVFLSILVVVVFGLDELGVSIVGDVPGGLPSFSAPAWSMDSMKALLPTALAISFVGFMESIAVAKAIQAKHKNYLVVPNQELIGLGLANILGSFFKAFPVTGGFSRTAVNDQAGARTGLASIISAVLIILTLLFLTEYFYFLPKAVLASIIFVAVFGLIDIKEAKHLWATDKRDFALFMITAIATLILGIEEGILIGVAISLIYVIYHVSYPHVATLGKVPGSRSYRNVNRFDNLEQWDDILIIRFDAQLYFANTTYFRTYIDKAIARKPNTKHLILDFKAINNLDSTAVHALHDLLLEYQENGIQIHFVEVKGPVRDIMKRNHLFELAGPEKFYVTIDDAIHQITGTEKQETGTYATQSNI